MELDEVPFFGCFSMVLWLRRRMGVNCDFEFSLEEGFEFMKNWAVSFVQFGANLLSMSDRAQIEDGY